MPAINVASSADYAIGSRHTVGGQVLTVVCHLDATNVVMTVDGKLEMREPDPVGAEVPVVIEAPVEAPALDFVPAEEPAAETPFAVVGLDPVEPEEA